MALAFIHNTKAEILKCKKTAALWLTAIGGAFIPAINILKCVGRPDYFVPKFQSDPWKVWLEFNWQIAAGFLLVIYIILVTSLVVQIEYRNGTWKQVYVSPRSYADIFFSKFLVINFMIILCFVLFNFSIVLGGYLTGLIQNQYPFSSYPVPWNEMISVSTKMYAASLAIFTIQYWLSLRFLNFIIPLGIGLGLFTAGFMIRQWEYIYYYPYLFTFLVYFKNPGLPTDTARLATINSFIWSGLVLILGFLDRVTTTEKG